MPQLAGPGVILATDSREDVENGGEDVGGDGKVRERRMQGLARPTANAFERSAFQRERRADRKFSHDDSFVISGRTGRGKAQEPTPGRLARLSNRQYLG